MAKRGTPRETLTPKPATAKTAAELSTMPNQQLAEQAAAWDEARANLKAATDAVEVAQAVLDGLAADAADDVRTQALQKLDDAKAAAASARAVIDGLTTPADHKIPEAKATEDNAATAERDSEATAGRESQVGEAESRASAATSEHMDATAGETAPVSPEAATAATGSQNTPESDDQGGGSNAAAPAAGPHRAFTIPEHMRSTIVAEATAQAEGVLTSIRAAVEAGADIGDVLAHLDGEIASAQLLQQATGAVVKLLTAARAELGRTATVWPLEVVRYGGQEHPIGVPLQVEPEIARQLVTAGAAVDVDPASAAAVHD